MSARSFIITTTLVSMLWASAAFAADWRITSQDDFGATGEILLDDIAVAQWSATMDPVAGFTRSWYGVSEEEGLFIGLAGESKRDYHEASVALLIMPIGEVDISSMRWGQSSVPINIVGGSLEFRGFTGAAQLTNDGSTGVHSTDPPGAEIIDPIVGTSSIVSPFVIQRRDGDAIQNPDWIVETPFGDGPVTVTYTSQDDPIQVVDNEGVVVDVVVENVPEPTAAVLLLLGLMAMFPLRRRR